MPETGLVISGNNGQPIESVYQLQSNGLYLPPMQMTLKELETEFHRKQLEDIVPNIQDITRYPCDCYRVAEGNRVNEIIIHLNDSHKWTREAIADWLDTLPIDLTIKKVA